MVPLTAAMSFMLKTKTRISCPLCLIGRKWFLHCWLAALKRELPKLAIMLRFVDDFVK